MKAAGWLALLGLGFLFAASKKTPSDPLARQTNANPAASINRNVESPYAPHYDPLGDPNRSSVSGGQSTDIMAELHLQPGGLTPAGGFGSDTAKALLASQPQSFKEAILAADASGSYPRYIAGVYIENPNIFEHLQINARYGN